MANKNYAKGASLENDVANRLARNGYATVRAAGSGTADRASCDVMAIDRSQILLVECKTYRRYDSDVVEPSDYQQMMRLVNYCDGGDRDLTVGREVRDMLVLREDGNMSPRYVEPFPAEYEPTGDEDLFKDVYYE